MKHLIDRALVWFKDGNGTRLDLNYKYYPLSVLYTSLLRERYQGKKIQFINVNFKSEKHYQLYPKDLRHNLHFHGGHFNYNDVFDFDHFNAMSEEQKKIFIWCRVNEIMAAAAETLGNTELEKANEYAYNTGMERSLNADYKILETEVVLFEQAVKAAIWYMFKEDGMYSYLVLTRDEKELFRKELAKGALGNPFFLVMYKRITANRDTLTIEYVRSAETRPVRTLIERAILK
jgi:hypothetical protein